MKKTILFLFCLPCFLWAQEQNEEVLRNVFNQLNGGHLFNEAAPYYALNQKGQGGRQVDGSQYLSSDWEAGLVLMPDNRGFEIKGRYDIYHDEIQILVGGQVQVLSAQQIKAVALEDKIFVRKKFDDTRVGFVEVLVEGPMGLYLKRTVHTKKANPHPVLGSTNDDFKIVIKEQYYYGIQNETLHPLKRKKKNVFKILKQEKETVTELVKNENLNVKNRVDLVRLFEHYNGHQNAKGK